MEQQSTPFIHPPDEKEKQNRVDAPARNGAFCFLNIDRPCGGDCMAYEPNPPAQVDYRGQWANCKVLVAAHQVSKHVVIAVGILGKATAPKPPPAPVAK